MQSKILVVNEDDTFEYVDMWFNESKIIGYYITNDNFEDESVNVILETNTITLKRSEKLINYLINNFNIK
jgi:hypothetical protein